MKRKKFFLHGDLQDTLSDKYYCGFCDSFELKEHFYSDFNHSSKNIEKFRTSLLEFDSQNEEFFAQYLRQKFTVNLFASINKKNSRFFLWLRKQSDRNDPIGNLARHAINDNFYPTDTSKYKTILQVLQSRGVSPEIISALHPAFVEYRIEFKMKPMKDDLLMPLSILLLIG